MTLIVQRLRDASRVPPSFRILVERGALLAPVELGLGGGTVAQLVFESLRIDSTLKESRPWFAGAVEVTAPPSFALPMEPGLDALVVRPSFPQVPQIIDRHVRLPAVRARRGP